MTESLPDLDARTNQQEAGIELKIGSSLFAVVDPRDPGTCGPYFTDKLRAILWAFYTSISNLESRPKAVNEKDSTTLLPNSWVKGEVATNWYFPKNHRVLLEIVLNRNVRFSNLMIDPNPFAYVNYRFGTHDPVSKTVQLNVDNDNVSLLVKQFADDKSWLAPTQPKVSYYGLMTMFPQSITKSTTNTAPNTLRPSWIVCSAANIIDANVSFGNLFHFAHPNPNLEQYHETVVEVGIRIHAPEQLAQSRYYYTLNFESLWLFFTAWLYQGFTIAQINQAISSVSDQVCPVSSKTQLPTITKNINLDANIVSIIVSKCETLKDAIAFLSINRHFRLNIYHRALIQSNLRIRFLPSIRHFFLPLHHQNTPERRNLLGVPKKSDRTDRWWMLGGVLFKEDFADEDLRLFPDQEAERRVSLEPKLVLPLIRSCNSFMTMFAMLYSLNHYSTLPRLVSLVINHNDEHGVHSLKLQATARMPEYMPKIGKTATEMLSATTTIDYPYTVSRIDCRGSWLHDVVIPYFFLEPAFADKLKNAKAFEMQRHTITMYYQKLKTSSTRGVPLEPTPSHRQALEIPLVNTLKLYRGEKMIAYINCYLVSGLPVDKHPFEPSGLNLSYIEILLTAEGLLNASIIENLFNRAYALATINQPAFTMQYSVKADDRYQRHPTFPDAPSPYQLLDTESIYIVRFELHRTLSMDQVYYEAYMYMTIFIRMLIHDEKVDHAHWSVNF
jgi:hypothetical protein